MFTEKLRHNDEQLKAVLEEREGLIAELLNVNPDDVADKVQVKITLYIFTYIFFVKKTKQRHSPYFCHLPSVFGQVKQYIKSLYQESKS